MMRRDILLPALLLGGLGLAGCHANDGNSTAINNGSDMNAVDTSGGMADTNGGAMADNGAGMGNGGDAMNAAGDSNGMSNGGTAGDAGSGNSAGPGTR